VRVFLARGGVPHEMIPSKFWKDPGICLACLYSAQMENQVDFNPWKYIQLRSTEFYSMTIAEGVAFAAERNNTRCAQRTPLLFWKQFPYQLALVVARDCSLSVIPSSLHWSVCVRVIEELDLHTTFFSTILKGICIHKHSMHAPAIQNHLPVLDRGTDIRMIIAEFLGVPAGRHLKRLRRFAKSKAFQVYWRQYNAKNSNVTNGARGPNLG
jgi:hypothetical protein